MVHLAVVHLAVVHLAVVHLAVVHAPVAHAPVTPMIRVLGDLGFLRPLLGVRPVVRGVEKEGCGGVEGGTYSSGRGDVGADAGTGHLLPEPVHELRELGAGDTAHRQDVRVRWCPRRSPPTAEQLVLDLHPGRPVPRDLDDEDPGGPDREPGESTA
ncbi:hypothetical protein [Kocuria marina]|uniref:hypothetical protein n=1 Tax=Kocuria marina TaxID=223184 RepID=UPI00155AE9D5|nr:hypothetical protein [Kocuria marina]